jgi:tripartite-type tricarboxylate transporter receptor subunit TctC
VDLLNAEINRALNGPEVREKLESVGLTVMNDPPQVFARSMREEYETIGKVIRAIGLQPQ